MPEAKVSLFAVALSLWAGFSAIWPMAQYYAARVETTAVHIGKHTITNQVYLPIQPLLAVWMAFSALCWFSSWTDIQTKNALKALRVSVVFMFLYSVAQLFGIGFQVNMWPKVILGGTFGNPTLLAVWLAMSISLFSAPVSFGLLALIIRCASLTGTIAGAIALLLKKSASRTIPVLIMLGFVLFYRHSSIVVDGLSDHGRFAMWDQAMAFWKMGNIWFGQGLGAYFYIYKDHVHNDYIELLADIGIVGVILLGLVMIDAFFKVCRLRDDARSVYGGILAAGAFSALTLFTFQWPATGILMLFALGRTYAEQGGT